MRNGVVYVLVGIDDHVETRPVRRPTVIVENDCEKSICVVIVFSKGIYIKYTYGLLCRGTLRTIKDIGCVSYNSQ